MHLKLAYKTKKKYRKDLTKPDKTSLFMRKLTDKQKKFLELYMDMGQLGEIPGPAFGNATKAAKMAGYKCKNPDSYRVIGYENKKKLNIDKKMKQIHEEQLKAYFEEPRKLNEITIARILKRIRK